MASYEPALCYNSNDILYRDVNVSLNLEPDKIGSNLLVNVCFKLSQQYMGKTDAENGYIFSLEDVRILDNNIGEDGHIHLRISMRVQSILPRKGLVFKCRATTILPDGCITNNPHFQSLIIGGELTEDMSYKFPCGCVLIKNTATTAQVDLVVFSRGQYTCICSHKCLVPKPHTAHRGTKSHKIAKKSYKIGKQKNQS